MFWAVRDETDGPHTLQICVSRTVRNLKTQGVRGAFRLNSRQAGANGRYVCSNKHHDNDRKRARNSEADTVDVAASINPQTDPGLVGLQVQFCVNLQRGERRAMRCSNPPLTTPVSTLLHRLQADYSSHHDSWHERRELSNRHRSDEQHLRDVAVLL